jgi:hypothetical protein
MTPAFVDSFTWTVDRYPGRMAGLKGLKDTAFREDLLMVMRRRLAVARAMPLTIEYSGARSRTKGRRRGDVGAHSTPRRRSLGTATRRERACLRAIPRRRRRSLLRVDAMNPRLAPTGSRSWASSGFMIFGSYFAYDSVAAIADRPDRCPEGRPGGDRHDVQAPTASRRSPPCSSGGF